MSAHVALTLPNMTINAYTATLTLSGESGAELIRILKGMQAAGMTQATLMPDTAPDGTALVCPVHNRPMKGSRKPGSWFCSAKVGEGYCDQRVKG